MTEPKGPGERPGVYGERIARLDLERRGWRVVATNYRCPEGEIDIIAEEPTAPEPTLVFIEVKTRRGMRHGAPREAVDSRKQRRVAAIAGAYLGSRNAGGHEPPCRFDVIEVALDADGRASVSHQQAAFGAE